MLVGDADI